MNPMYKQSLPRVREESDNGRQTIVSYIPIMPEPVESTPDGMWEWMDCQWMEDGLGFPQSGIEDHCFFQQGSILYASEPWAMRNGQFIYMRDTEDDDPDSTKIAWQAPWLMPLCAARNFFRVRAISVERHPFTHIDFEEWDEKALLRLLSKYGWEARPWFWKFELEPLTAEEAFAELENKERR